MKVDGAVIVITGASHGIGRATALGLAERGASVVAIGRDLDALTEVATQTGGVGVVEDVADITHAPRVIDRTLAEFGRVDAVIANAGVGYVGAFEQMPTTRLSSMLDINFRAPMLLAHAALPVMAEQGHGTISFVTSIAGAVPVAREAAYCVSKAALESFADCLRDELRDSPIQISTIRPGVVHTHFHDSRSEAYERRWPRPMPAERIATTVIETLEHDLERRTEPRWLGLPAWLHESTPRLYRSLSHRFG